MKGKFLQFAFLLVALFSSTSIFAQKTATTVINDVLKMTGVAGNVLGYEIKAVVPERVEFGKFFIAPVDIKEKTLNQLSTAKLKFFSNKNPSEQTFVTGTNANSNVRLSLTQTGITVSGTISSLGTLVFYPANPAGSEIKYNIPSNLTVLFPSSTSPNNVLYGKTTRTIKFSDGRISTSDAVIYIDFSHSLLPG